MSSIATPTLNGKAAFTVPKLANVVPEGENRLRELIKSGKLKAVQDGRNYSVLWADYLEYRDEHGTFTPKPHPYHRARKPKRVHI